MERKKTGSHVWNFLAPEKRRWLDPIFVVVAVVLGSMIGQKKGLLLGLAVGVLLLLVRSVVYHFVFRRPG